MTTRRYPRTLGQAFPRTPLYACALERPAKAPYSPVLWVSLAAGLAAALLTAWSH